MTTINSYLVRSVFHAFGLYGPITEGHLDFMEANALGEINAFLRDETTLEFMDKTVRYHPRLGTVRALDLPEFSSLDEVTRLAEMVADQCPMLARCEHFIYTNSVYNGRIYDQDTAMTFEFLSEDLPDGGFILTFDESRRNRLVRPNLVMGLNFDWNQFSAGFAQLATL